MNERLERQAGHDFTRNHQIGGETDGITPDAAADQGIISYTEADNLNGRRIPVEFPEIVQPAEETLRHWLENTEMVTVGDETRLYAVGEKGEYFTYIVCASDRIDRNTEQILEKARDVLHAIKEDQEHDLGLVA